MTANPYQPRETEEYSDALLRPERGRGVAAASLVLMLISTVGSSVMLWTMFQGLERSAGTEAPDPAAFAAEARHAMAFSFAGIAAGLLGGGLAAWTLFGAGNRERWFFWSGLIVTLLQLITFPFGIFIGIILIVGWVVRWREFHPRAHAGISSSDPPAKR